MRGAGSTSGCLCMWPPIEVRSPTVPPMEELPMLCVGRGAKQALSWLGPPMEGLPVLCVEKGAQQALSWLLKELSDALHRSEHIG